MIPHFLIVEDSILIQNYLRTLISPYGRVFCANSLSIANDLLSKVVFDIAFIDLKLDETTQKLEGLEVLQLCTQKNIQSVVLSNYEDKNIFDQAYQKGAHHFFSKGNLVQKKQDNHPILNFIKLLKPDHFKEFFETKFFTKDKALQSKIKFLYEQALNRNQNILFSGPTGVGKTRIAKMIHNMTQPKRPFIEKNLAEINENLLESELFGHKKGAFTGALQDKIGLLELANDGTLFLDEIGSIPINIQQKLLKIIEEKKFMPLGCNQEVHSNFFLMTATCENLANKVSNGEFRVDFYFRIKGLEIEIPSLKERRPDIIPLFDFFISKYKKKISFTMAAQAKLVEYNWYGNIRELRSLVNEFINYPKGLIQERQLPKYIQDNVSPFNQENINKKNFLNATILNHINEKGLPSLIKEVEQEALAHFIQQRGNKINTLSRHLKISKSVFYRIKDELEQSTSL